METYDLKSILNYLNDNPAVSGVLAVLLLATVVHLTVSWLSRRNRRRNR